jgi:hypothetical protein
MTRVHKTAILIGVPLPLIGLLVAIISLWNRAVGPLELGLLVGSVRRHHAFPTLAFHGLRFWERIADPTGLLIALLEKLGIVWNVVRISPERQQAKTLSPDQRRRAMIVPET